MRRVLCPLLAAAFLAAAPALAQERVDLELVLLADASGSIDEAELRFQREGYADAITDPAVLGAIAQGYDQKIALTYVEWGSHDSQDVVVPWTVIDGDASAAAFAAALLRAPRRARGSNSIGNAITFAHGLIEENDVEGHRRVIDLSADSAWDRGGVPMADARAAALGSEITINGLAILCRDTACSGRPVSYDLEQAFAERIVGGPGSFVVTADGKTPFAAAVRRKLVLEIAGHFDAPEGPARLAAR